MADFLLYFPRICIMACMLCLIIALVLMFIQAPWDEILSDEEDEQFERELWFGDDEAAEDDPDDCYSEVAG